MCPFMARIACAHKAAFSITPSLVHRITQQWHHTQQLRAVVFQNILGWFSALPCPAMEPSTSVWVRCIAGLSLRQFVPAQRFGFPCVIAIGGEGCSPCHSRRLDCFWLSRSNALTSLRVNARIRRMGACFPSTCHCTSVVSSSTSGGASEFDHCAGSVCARKESRMAHVCPFVVAGQPGECSTDIGKERGKRRSVYRMLPLLRRRLVQEGLA